MAIYTPGRRSRHNKSKKPGKRSVVAVLQLTAMVDMFTVLTVFLLQNYATTGEVISLPKEVKLPNAAAVKELHPSNVVVISTDDIMLNNQSLVAFTKVKEQEDWMIKELKESLEKLIQEGEKEKLSLGNQIRKAVNETKTADASAPKDVVDQFRKITIQADKEVDFLTVKKVMFTVTEAGIFEINFAVIKRPSTTAQN